MKNLLKIVFGVLIITLVGCERNDILQSEKKLNERIQGSWKALKPSSGETFEVWTFGSDGVVTISWTDTSTSSTFLNTAYYSIDARFSNAYLKLRDFSFSEKTNTKLGAEDLNRDWVIVDLDDNGLFVSGTDEGGFLRSIEFKKQ